MPGFRRRGTCGDVCRDHPDSGRCGRYRQLCFLWLLPAERDLISVDHAADRIWDVQRMPAGQERLYFSLVKIRKEQAGGRRNPPVMKEVLDAVANRVEAIVRKDGAEQWRLTFPDYYEEGKENTPARIIDIVYHGTGHKYRNCFLNRGIQFDKYDEVFPFAAAQESTDTCVSIIRNRLRRGPAPKEEWSYRYIDYIRTERSRPDQEHPGRHRNRSGQRAGDT